MDPAPNQEVKQTYQGGCHCRKIRYEFETAKFDNGEATVTSCNCSLCVQKGSMFVFTDKPHFKFLAGSLDDVTAYQFGKKQLTHYFCSTCGCATHGAATAGDGIGVNVRSIDRIELEKLKLKHLDGKSL